MTSPRRHSSWGNISSSYEPRIIHRLRKLLRPLFLSFASPLPGPGRSIDATRDSANDDSGESSKMHPPGAGQQHQQQQQQLQSATAAGSPHSPSAASQFPLQLKRAMHSSSSGPPPKRPTTRDEGGGGHSVKRVGTDTLHPPTKRWDTGNEVHEAT